MDGDTALTENEDPSSLRSLLFATGNQWVMYDGSNVQAHDIKQYAESLERSGGGPVEKVTQLNRHSFVVRFQDHKDAVNVLLRRTHSIKGWSLTGFLCDEGRRSVFSGHPFIAWEGSRANREQMLDLPRVNSQQTTTVLVTGCINDWLSSDKITKHFRQNTACPVDVHCMEPANIAFAVFTNSEDALRVTTTIGQTFDGTDVNVYLYRGVFSQCVAGITHQIPTADPLNANEEQASVRPQEYPGYKDMAGVEWSKQNRRGDYDYPPVRYGAKWCSTENVIQTSGVQVQFLLKSSSHTKDHLHSSMPSLLGTQLSYVEDRSDASTPTAVTTQSSVIKQYHNLNPSVSTALSTQSSPMEHRLNPSMPTTSSAQLSGGCSGHEWVKTLTQQELLQHQSETSKSLDELRSDLDKVKEELAEEKRQRSIETSELKSEINRLKSELSQLQMTMTVHEEDETEKL